MAVWFRQICIYVSDIDASVKFYEALGLTCTTHHRINPDLVEATLENPERGSWLQLAQDANIKTPIDLGQSIWKIYLYTDEIDQAHDRALQAGYPAFDPPRQLANWPFKVAFFKDPDGYLVELVENKGKARSRDDGGFE